MTAQRSSGAHALEGSLRRALRKGPVFITGAVPAVVEGLRSNISADLLDQVRFVDAFTDAVGLALVA